MTIPEFTYLLIALQKSFVNPEIISALKKSNL